MNQCPSAELDSISSLVGQLEFCVALRVVCRDQSLHSACKGGFAPGDFVLFVLVRAETNWEE
jgi:hypothetical protein